MSKYNPSEENGSVESSEEDIIEAKDGGEILTDGGVTANQKDMPTPKDTKEKLGGIGGMARATTHWENPLEVTGTAGLDDEPRVSISLGDEGEVHEASIVVSFDPDEARELAAMLQRRADYAEEYAIHRQKQEE